MAHPHRRTHPHHRTTRPRPRKHEMTDIAEQAARVLRQATNDGANKTEDYAQALADAGLLREPARTLPTREQIARALSTHHYSIAYGGCACGADFEDETETLEAEQEAYNQH